MANNKIQIKRSTANATVTGLSNGELAFTANGKVFYIGDPAGSGNSIRIGGEQVPGTLTANQALVANATSGIDKVIVANLVPSSIFANGTSGTGGQVLHANSVGGLYWEAPSAGVAGSDTQVQFNDGGALAGDAGFTFNKTSDTLSTNTVLANTVNAAVLSVGSSSIANSSGVFTTGTVNGTIVSVGTAVISNSTGVFTTGTVNGATVSVGTSVIANSTRLALGTSVGLQVNGSIGTSGQILYSNGTTAFWDAPPAGDITSVVAGDGLTGGGTSGEVTLNVGSGNGITVTADSVAAVGGDGLVVNSTGIHVVSGNGITVAADSVSVNGANGISVDSSGVNVLAGTNGGLVSNSTGVFITAGSGLVTNATGLHVGTGNGIAVDADSIRVAAGNSQVVSNSSGVYIVEGQINHDNLSGFVGNEHVDHSTVSITAGNGLTGGGDITTTRILSVVAGDGLTVNSTGVHVGAANGISVAADTVGVTTGSTLTVNSTGVHVNSALSITDLTLSGNLTINGTLTTVDTTNLTIKDSMIELANGNGSTDSLDIGFYGQYGATGTKFTGLFRDATDGVFKLFTGSGTEPTTTVDTGAAGYTIATLLAYINSGGLVSNATNVTITANSTVAVGITANTLTLTTALAATSGGTGTATYTSGDILVANTGNALSKLALGTSGYVLQSNGTALVYDTLDGGTF